MTNWWPSYERQKETKTGIFSPNKPIKHLFYVIGIQKRCTSLREAIGSPCAAKTLDECRAAGVIRGFCGE